MHSNVNFSEVITTKDAPLFIVKIAMGVALVSLIVAIFTALLKPVCADQPFYGQPEIRYTPGTTITNPDGTSAYVGTITDAALYGRAGIYYRIGNTVTNPDGSISQVSGSTLIKPDGSSCTISGSRVNC